MATAAEEFAILSSMAKMVMSNLESSGVAFETLRDALNQAYKGPYSSRIATTFNTILRTYASGLTAMGDAIKTQLTGIGAASDVDIQGGTANWAVFISLLRDWMHANTTVLTEQGQTVSITPGVSNVGTGLQQIVTVDKYGYKLSNIYPGDCDLECIMDASMSVANGTEIFQVKPDNEGTNPVDSYAKSTYGSKTTQRSINPVLSNLVPQGFFSGVSGTGVPTSLGSWTPDGSTPLANILAASTSLWHTDQSYSLLFKNVSGSPLASDTTFSISVPTTVAFKNQLPYTGFLVYQNATNAADADLTYTVGTKSTTVTLSDAGGSLGAMTRLEWKKDKDSYFENFKPTPTSSVAIAPVVTITITLKSGMANGAGVLIHGAFLNVCASLGRCPILITGGPIGYVVGDTIAFKNTLTTPVLSGAGGIVVKVLRDLLGISLPSKPTGTGGYTVIPDPT